MIKIPNIEQIRKCEADTIAHKPISSIELMEIAAEACVNQIKQQFSPTVSIAVFCGMGNNGGDGLAIVRLLHENGFNSTAYLVKHKDTHSSECQHQLNLLKKRKIKVKEIGQENDIPPCDAYDIIVDALLGIGLNKPIDNQLLKAVINTINQSDAFVFAVDTPSGLLSEQPMNQQDTAIAADFTLTFQFPKLSFFFAENYQYAGEWEIADIGLESQYINEIETNYYCVEHHFIQPLIRPREKFAHKGDFGHGLLIAGSFGMMGAAVLASKAALRTGIGLLTVCIPKIGYHILQTTVNEAVCRCDENENHFTGIDFASLSKYNAIAVGCGLGTHPETAQGLKKLIGDFGGNLIFDADAINILAANKTWLEFLPPDCIFTPHIKEFERLTHKVNNSFERLELQRQFSMRYRCIVVLKGAHTSITTPQGEVYFNTSGNPGMAKGGSGDVLTGMILSLAAQGYTAVQAAVVGVYLHGAAADLALEKHSCQSLLPSDIIEHIGGNYKA
ncbi:MAG: NAD(P)H-hydrate dehydratase [Lentimicrobiaceae bacterium]|nr:NAD(P)H-hydrate dehydratase [Lentimicrobiaceae bacterium]